ncbi:MAG TPA: MurT ligase domain-containing protein [Acidimicrobiales bacterium]|nr:MurT ligase domain-containing protein [Acidimicrobiales bacterium]
MAPSLPLRTRVATGAGLAVAGLSRRVGAGEGSVIGGRVLLAVDPGALTRLAAGRPVALVSGTNGKTTTTSMLAAALGTLGPVVTNSTGANLMSGLVTTLARGRAGAPAVLEVDEGLLPRAVAGLHPSVVLLLNLSRDQLDRIGEVRIHAQRWRAALEGAPSTAVVANADDPLVVWAAGLARQVTWVGTGQRWRLDAYSCPNCGEQIDWDDSGHWACTNCSLARPQTHLSLEGEDVVLADGRRVQLQLQLPGWPNRANAAMAAAGAEVVGVDVVDGLAAMGTVAHVAGRYQVLSVDGVRVRLLLAKNPAGWAEALDLLRPAPMPVVVGINARIPDGRDPSWLWDVPFERLRGRLVIATGDRGRDLAVRLRYAEVEHRFVDGYLDAVRATGATDIDLAANYTSFQDARRELARA